MSAKTGIQWTHATWNPVRGCSRVSPGCENCYAERVAARFSGPGRPYHGLAVMTEHGPRWTREVRLVPEHLTDPIRWKKGKRIFVNSMSDLFHERLDFEEIARVFAVMLSTPRHTFQILTKRAKRMRAFYDWLSHAHGSDGGKKVQIPCDPVMFLAMRADRAGLDARTVMQSKWPPPNVWLGVSVEDEERAAERLPDLLCTPADVRFASYEPALGPVDFSVHIDRTEWTGGRGLDWIIVGGESGPGARGFNLSWARSVIEQGRSAGVPVFVKQLGAAPYVCGSSTGREVMPGTISRIELGDGHGGNPREWPEDLRVRSFPGEMRP